MIRFKLLTDYEQKNSLPNITPLVDLIFNLLLFFLLTYAVAAPALQVELPAAASSQPLTVAGVQVTISKDGALFLEGEPVGEADLSAALVQALSEQQTKEVIVSAAKELPFEKVVRIIDLAGQAGGQKISLAVEPVSAGSPAAAAVAGPDQTGSRP